MTRNREIELKAEQNTTNQLELEGYIKGALWADQHPRKGLWDSEKAIKFIKDNVREYHKSGVFHIDDFIKDLTKEMED